MFSRHEIAANIPNDVFDEYYVPPRGRKRKPLFNTDFLLRVTNQENLGNIRSCCASVLPNTMGAEVFATIDTHTQELIRTELIAGEAFGIKYFKKYVAKVDEQLTALAVPVRFGKCAYCRMFVIEDDICFLAFVDDETPTETGEQVLLRSDDQGVIACHRQDGRITCIDGWIRTDSEPWTGRVLVATQE